MIHSNIPNIRYKIALNSRSDLDTLLPFNLQIALKLSSNLATYANGVNNI